jgi:hypothetical protein
MQRPSVVAATAVALLQPRIAGAAAAPAASGFRHVTRRQHTTMRYPVRTFSSSTYTLSAAPSDVASASAAAGQQQQQQQKPQQQQRRTGWIVAGVAVLSFCLGRASIERGPEVEPQYPQFQQQQQSEDKHVRGERKLPSLIETPTDAPVAAAPTPSPSASLSNKTDAAGLPVTFTAAGAGTAASEEEPSPTHPDHSSCRACRDGGEAAKLSAYEAQLAAEAEANAVAAAAAASFSVNADGTVPTTGGLPSPATAASPPTCPPCFAYSHSLCPLNRAEVGRAAWGFLHTVAAYYPSHPTVRQQEDMASLLTLYVKLYPCGYCADRSMEHLEREPIEQHVRSQNDLAQWMCRMHNEVNERLGKPMFDCKYVNQRWRDGQNKTTKRTAQFLFPVRWRHRLATYCQGELVAHFRFISFCHCALCAGTGPPTGECD